MGKASKRMKRNQTRRIENERKENSTKLESSMQELMGRGDYGNVLNVLAELTKVGKVTADDMYMGAYAYFMLNDYDRATKWVSTTLTTNPQHIGARILLARICLINRRLDDGLAIFDFIAEHYAGQMSDAEEEDCYEILSFYKHREEEKIKANYPHLVKFLGLAAEQAADTVEELAPATSEPMMPAEPAAPVEETAPIATPAAPTAAAGDEIATILAKDINITAKVRLLNSFAGGHYFAGELASARALLLKALELDHDENTLTGLALIAYDEGDSEQALAYAAKKEVTDFLLLRTLREG